MIPKLKVRGFEVVKGWEEKGVQLPKRATAKSAGNDFFVVEDITIPPTYFVNECKPFLLPTGVKAYMKPDEVLYLYNRSSNPRLGLQLANNVGIIDADYYGNPKNDGHIYFALWNFATIAVNLKRGDRIGQGIFAKYLVADDDTCSTVRQGGFGSTNGQDS